MRLVVGSAGAPTAGGESAPILWRWNSPALYLFGGLAAMMGLITVALIVLLCSKPKPSPGGSSSPPSGEKQALAPLVDAEPKVLVIMAGDAVPSFLAKAVPFLHPEQP